MLHVLVADDHTIVRYGISLLIKELYDYQVRITEASSFTTVLSLLEKQSYDLVILDINIPGGDSVQMVELLKLRNPDSKILIFSAASEHLYGIRYLQAGINGYLMKDSSESEIRTAIKMVLNDEIYTSTTMKQYLLRNISLKKDPQRNPIFSLSVRETEVMHQLIKGQPIASIAKRLNLQISTISTYKTRIYEKMNVTNLVELLEKVKLCVPA